MDDTRAAAPAGRLEYVDMLRGLALLGMLTVHFQYYARGESGVSSVVSSMVEGSFYPLFACLFGVGFALQFERSQDSPTFVRVYVRRLLALAGIALVTLALTGYHVLHLYAAWGFVLLFLRRWSTRSLVILALLMIVAVPLFEAGRFVWENAGQTVEASNARYRREAEAQAASRKAMMQTLATEGRIKREGPFPAIIAMRLRRQASMDRMFAFSPAYNLLPVFIIGMMAVRRRVLADPAANRRLLWTVFGVAVGLAIAARWLPAVLPKPPPFQADPLGNRTYIIRASFVYAFLYLAENFWQGLAYATAFLLLVSRFPLIRRFMTPLADAGRMSLTNYISQLVVLELVFSEIWLHAPVTPAWALAGTFVLFGLQVVASRWWMTRFRYGPLEWLWRSLTYARWEPMRRAAAASPVA